MFAVTRNTSQHQKGFDIIINEKTVVSKLNVIATAGGLNKAINLVFNDIVPHNGVIQIRFKGDSTNNEEAFVQALEISQNLVGKGATPVSFEL